MTLKPEKLHFCMHDLWFDKTILYFDLYITTTVTFYKNVIKKRIDYIMIQVYKCSFLLLMIINSQFAINKLIKCVIFLTFCITKTYNKMTFKSQKYQNALKIQNIK